MKLTYLAFFVKAAARALKDIPIVNSTFDEPAGEIALLDRYATTSVSLLPLPTD